MTCLFKQKKIEFSWKDPKFFLRDILSWIRTKVIVCLVVAFQILKMTNSLYHVVFSRMQSCNSLKTIYLSLWNFHKRVVGAILNAKHSKDYLNQIDFYTNYFQILWLLTFSTKYWKYVHPVNLCAGNTFTMQGFKQ